MCGIVGMCQFSGGVNPKIIQAMADTIAHRGPDGQGFLFANKERVKFLQSGENPGFEAIYALGHKRLSIIDLDGGTQPLSNDDGSVWITYNGEIYNHRNSDNSSVGWATSSIRITPTPK